MMVRRLLFLVIALCGFTFSAVAQITNVRGQLVDAENGEPLIGASVKVKGTTKGTVTDFDGNFALKANKGATLILNYLGYIEQTKNVTRVGSQNFGVIKMESDAVGLNEVTVLASVVTDRKTPVSVATVNEAAIDFKLGTQEYPEILKTTPSVYTSKEGGGYGDATVYVRGFDSNNVGVLINGIPVNDMESGKVYWSNWAGLSDVTRTMQVQRGLGASKLGLSSVGGTINVLLKGAEAKKGGSVRYNVGPDGYQKELLSVSTGMMDNGWSVTMLGGHTISDGYALGTNFDAWSYFMNVTKVVNASHMFSFMITGAPQWHNQRGNKHTIQWYRDNKDGIRASSDYGIRNGEMYGGGYGYNEYHKPQAQLNHYWTIDDSSELTTSLYASVGSGSGRRIDGDQDNLLSVNYKTGLDEEGCLRTPNGLLDFDAAAQVNKDNLAQGAQVFIGDAVNNHVWYGLLSNYSKTIDQYKFTAGIDARYYVGDHYQKISDLLGATYALDVSSNGSSVDATRAADTYLKEGDKYSYHNKGRSAYTGVFGQAEYAADKLTGFVSAAVARKAYQREEFFKVTTGGPEESSWEGFYPWNVKAGASYKLNENNTVYANGGYVKRAPFFSDVFLNYTNEINNDVKYEKIITFEVGYKFNSRQFDATVSAYRTEWNDRALRKSFGQTTANLSGVDELHQGIEVTAEYRPMRKLTFNGMLSVGDWTYSDNFHATTFDDDQNIIDSFTAYTKDVHVGNSAQLTASLSGSYEILPKLRVSCDYVYYANNYSDFDPSYLTDEATATDAWELPEAGLFDLGFSYSFKVGGLDASLNGHLNNVFDTEYISKAEDGATHSSADALVYYGFGRQWSTGLKIKF